MDSKEAIIQSLKKKKLEKLFESYRGKDSDTIVEDMEEAMMKDWEDGKLDDAAYASLLEMMW